MQFKVNVGEVVSGFFFTNQTTPPAPMQAQVLGVRRGAILVPENESINGIAVILCHSASEDGTYWYEYTKKDGTAHSSSVAKLWVPSHSNITDNLKGPFIVDET